MRGATECAKRLKVLFNSLWLKLGKVGRPPVTDPITQLILGILSRDTPETKASEGLERLRSMVVDYNELRVIPPIELAAVLSDFPDVRIKCEDISRALNSIFTREHAISLDRLANLPRKEVVAALDAISGLEPYTRARIRLLGLRQHAIPLDQAMWAYARAQGIVDPRCPLAEAQQFLERQIPEEDALEFFALLKRQAWSEMAGAIKRGEVEPIRSVPPDRTARNMLQTISATVLDEPDQQSSAERQKASSVKASPAGVRRKAAAVSGSKSKSTATGPVVASTGRLKLATAGQSRSAARAPKDESKKKGTASAGKTRAGGSGPPRRR